MIGLTNTGKYKIQILVSNKQKRNEHINQMMKILVFLAFKEKGIGKPGSNAVCWLTCVQKYWETSTSIIRLRKSGGTHETFTFVSKTWIPNNDISVRNFTGDQKNSNLKFLWKTNTFILILPRDFFFVGVWRYYRVDSSCWDYEICRINTCICCWNKLISQIRPRRNWWWEWGTFFVTQF